MNAPFTPPRDSLTASAIRARVALELGYKCVSRLLKWHGVQPVFHSTTYQQLDITLLVGFRGVNDCSQLLLFTAPLLVRYVAHLPFPDHVDQALPRSRGLALAPQGLSEQVVVRELLL